MPPNSSTMLFGSRSDIKVKVNTMGDGNSGLQGVGIAQFMERRGRTVREACGVLWHTVEGGLYVSVPHQLKLTLPGDELVSFLWKGHATGVRYPSTHSPGLPSGLYELTAPVYSFSNVHRNFKAKIRKGQENCQIVELEAPYLLKHGLALNLKTMKRQNRYDAEFGAENNWRRLVGAIAMTPCIRVYGALVEGNLAAYAITCREDGWLHILHRMSRDEYLDHCPNHVLDYTITQEINTDPNVRAVSMGYASLVADSGGLHEYKTRLGYNFSPHNSVIRLHPVAGAILLNRLTRRLLAAAHVWRKDDSRISKVEAVLQGAEMSRNAGGRRVSANETNPDRAVSTQ